MSYNAVQEIERVERVQGVWYSCLVKQPVSNIQSNAAGSRKMCIAIGILTRGHTLIVDVYAGFGRAPKADAPDPIPNPMPVISA